MKKSKLLLNLSLPVLTCISAIPMVTITSCSKTNCRYQLNEDGKSYSVIGRAGKSVDKELTILTEYKGKPVTGIAKEAFANDNTIETIKIPQGIKTIGYKAFYNCSALKRVYFPASLTKMDANIFSYCPALSSIYVDSKNEVYASDSYGSYVYEIADSKLVVGTCKFKGFEEPIDTIGAQAFAGRSMWQKNISLESVKVIEDGAFIDSPIESIYFGKKLKTIGIESFRNCNRLTAIAFPNTLTSLASNAFNGCTRLTTVDMSAIDRGVSGAQGMFEGCRFKKGNSIILKDKDMYHLFSQRAFWEDYSEFMCY